MLTDTTYHHVLSFRVRMRLEIFQAVQLIFQHSRLERNILAHCSEFLAVVANEKCVAAIE